jgi:hypothetical protein
MRRKIVVAPAGIALSSGILTSCDTPIGQGAAWGAATGAIIGGAATGHVRAASIGAAAGAAAGALTGAIVQENQAARYGPPPPGDFLLRGGPVRQVFTTARTRGAGTIFGEFRRADLPAT